MAVGRLRAVGLLAVALFVAFFHVCLWPNHTHAAESHSHDVATPTDSHPPSSHRPDGDAVHVASCDAIGTAAVSLPLAAGASAIVLNDLPLVAIPRYRVARATEVQPSGVSPPLFLLHAALLI